MSKIHLLFKQTPKEPRSKEGLLIKVGGKQFVFPGIKLRNGQSISLKTILYNANIDMILLEDSYGNFYEGQEILEGSDE